MGWDQICGANYLKSVKEIPQSVQRTTSAIQHIPKVEKIILDDYEILFGDWKSNEPKSSYLDKVIPALKRWRTLKKTRPLSLRLSQGDFQAQKDRRNPELLSKRLLFPAASSFRSPSKNQRLCFWRKEAREHGQELSGHENPIQNGRQKKSNGNEPAPIPKHPGK